MSLHCSTMFAIKKVYDVLFAPPPTQEWYLNEYNRLVEEFESFRRNGDDETANYRHVEESYMPDAKLFKYTGNIR